MTKTNNSCDSDEDDRAKLDAYLDLIETRILGALASDAVQQSCSATLLLVFAAIDSLGKLTHPEAEAAPGDRFRYFLESLGPRYKQRSDELWKLRNALVHNAISIESYLSSVELEGWAHLEDVGPEGLLYINTRTASADLRQAFSDVKVRVATDPRVATTAAGRLEWFEGSCDAVAGDLRPTPPPPVQFIWAR